MINALIHSSKFILLAIIFASCLPQEKTTQCGSGEAYNATERRCVATLANNNNSISIATISPTSSYAISSADVSKTHSLTVSDPYSLGYSLKWYLTNGSGNQSLVSTASTYTLVHSALAEGTYILEAQLYDKTGSQLLDTRAWTISVIDDARPEIGAVTGSPISTTTTASAFDIQSTITNIDSLTVDYKWFVNAVQVATGSFNNNNYSLDYNFDPDDPAFFNGAGIYTVQLVLYEDGSGVTYDTETWTIQNNIPGFANVTLGDYTTSFGETGTTPNTANKLHVFDSLDFYDGDGATNSGIKYDTDADGFLDSNVDVCVTVDDYQGVQSTGVFVDFLWNGVAIPNANGVQFTAGDLTKCMAQVIEDAGASVANIYTTAFENEAAVLTAVVYDAYSGSSTYPSYGGGTEVKRYNWNVNLRKLNTAPTVTIDSTNTTLTCTSTGGTSPTSYSGCSMAQYDPTDATSTVKLAINVEDDDYDATDYAGDAQYFKVVYKIGTVQIDNAVQPVTTPPTIHEYSEADCVHEYSETLSAARYICDFNLLSYGTNGPIDPTGQTYVVEAYVQDQQSPYSATGSNNSNSVTWTIETVTAADYHAEITDFDSTGTQSYVELLSGGGALTINTPVAATVKETDKVNFNVATNSNGRDSHYYKVFRCSDATCTTQELIESAQDNSTNASNPRTKTITVTISEDAVVGSAEADVYYRVDVYEDSTKTTAADSSNIFYLPVQNYNPDPTFNTSPFTSPAQNTLATPLIGFSGYPLTIDPGTITDSSGSDGEVIKYQWAISTDGGATYSAIDGATSRVLYWTPGSELNYADQDGEDIQVKLCLGDDGYHNATVNNKDPMDGNDCRSAALDSGDWYVKVLSNMQQGYAYDTDNAGNTSKGEIAVWIDPSSKDPIVKYVAYANQSNEIVVEKYVLKTDSTTYTGEKGGSVSVNSVYEMRSITFPSISGGTGTQIENLSMSGDATNGSLYIAYQAAKGSPSVDMVHIRRIDISGDKSAFLHPGKFSFDPQYNGLTSNLTLGNNLTLSGTDSDGASEITVDDTGANTGASMTIRVANLHGGDQTLTNGTDFCTTVVCSTTTITATEIANAINTTGNTEFQGLTATASGSTITLSGIFEDDYLESDLGAIDIGDIMVNLSAGKWMLPYVDGHQPLGNKNKISIRQGDLGSALSLSNAASTTLTGTAQAQEVASDILESDRDGDSSAEYNDRILIAVRVSGTGEINLYEYSSALALQESGSDIFADDSVSDIKLSISQHSDNENAYVMGKNSSGGFAYARISHTAGNFDLNGLYFLLKVNDNHPLWENFAVDYYDITAGSDDKELLFVGVHNTDLDAYILKLEGDSTIKVSCNPEKDETTLVNCQPLVTTTTDNVFSLPVAFGDVLPDVTIGSAGGTSSENIQDITVVGFHIDDGGGSSTTDALPILGVINTKGIDLSGDDTAPGGNYNLPYVND